MWTAVAVQDVLVDTKIEEDQPVGPIPIGELIPILDHYELTLAICPAKPVFIYAHINLISCRLLYWCSLLLYTFTKASSCDDVSVILLCLIIWSTYCWLLLTCICCCLVGVTKWCEKWKSNGWKLANGGSVTNKEELEELLESSSGLKVTYVSIVF